MEKKPRITLILGGMDAAIYFALLCLALLFINGICYVAVLLFLTDESVNVASVFFYSGLSFIPGLIFFGVMLNRFLVFDGTSIRGGSQNKKGCDENDESLVAARKSELELERLQLELESFTKKSLTERVVFVEAIRPLMEGIIECSQNLSKSTLVQSSELGGISSALTELTERTKTYTTHTEHANKLSAETLKFAMDGNERMQEMAQTMEDMREQNRDVAKIISSLDDIADNTKILGINASIEAAIAGTYGKGFEIVAQEIRRLAVRATSSSKEGANLLRKTLKMLENSVGVVEGASSIFDAILTDISEISTLISEISNESAQQFADIESAGNGIREIDNVVQQNMGNSSEIKMTSGQVIRKLSKLTEQEGLLFETAKPVENITVLASTDIESPVRKEVPVDSADESEATFSDMEWDFDSMSSDASEPIDESVTSESKDREESNEESDSKAFTDMEWDFDSESQKKP